MMEESTSMRGGGISSLWILLVLCLTFSCHSVRSQAPAGMSLPPLIIRGPPKSLIYRSEEVTLECKGKGIPEVTYEWLKNGEPLNTNRDTLQLHHGTLTLNPASSMDDGFYQCSIKNQYGTAFTDVCHLQKAFLFSAAGQANRTQQSVTEGSPFFIQAGAKNSLPKPTITWEKANSEVDKNPIPLPLSRRIQIAENGDLHFAYAIPKDSLDGNIYKCSMYNAFLDIRTGGCYTRLTVTKAVQNTTRSAPILLFSSQPEVTAVIGRSISLRCFFAGNPEPSVTWSGPRNAFLPGRYTQDKYDTELIINNIDALDEGNYTCTATNSEGKNQTTLEMRVQAAPTFNGLSDGPHDVNVTEGASVTFNCSAPANPEAQIVWLRNGEPFEISERFQFSTDKKSLTIRDVCRDCSDKNRQPDLMVIQCNASNIHGYAFGSGYLNVLRRTRVRLDGEANVTADVRKENNFKFGCNSTSDPSTPAVVRWYKVGKDKEDQLLGNDSSYLSIKEKLLTIRANKGDIKGWKMLEGRYKCVADNGYSIDSATVDLHLDPESIYEQPWWLQLWWLIIIVGVVLLLVIVTVFCCICRRRNKGDVYDAKLEEKRDFTGGVTHDVRRSTHLQVELVTPPTLDSVYDELDWQESNYTHLGDVNFQEHSPYSELKHID